MRKTIDLSGIWNFRFEGQKSGSAVSVPGCFDVLKEWYGKRGTAFYRRSVQTGGRVALFIDGVGVEAEVFWDGKSVGRCPYAYMPERFIFDAGERGEHELMIAVSNRYNQVVFPYYDFYAYGGIFGKVTLEELPENFLDKVQIHTTDYQKREIEINLTLFRFLRKEKTISFVFDSTLKHDVLFRGKTQTFHFTLPEFALWSPETPCLHTVKIIIGDDELEETFGIREIKAAGQDLFLNGEKLFLKGVNRHESHPQFGAATPPALMAADLHLLKDAGCNFIRGSHYPQRKEFLELCDRMGLLVWEETLGWDVKPPYLFSGEFAAIQKDEVRRMVNVHYNHPCIIIWGFLNETESQLPRTRKLISALYQEIRKLDCSRLITFASNKYEKDCCMDLVDIVSMNPYPGWYGASWEAVSGIPEIEPRLQNLYRAIPEEKPFIISEIGSAALYGYHDEYKTRWTEEYQAELVAEVCRVTLNEPRFSGLVFWQFCDAKSYINGSVLGRPRGFNNKGLLDEYRRPKLAWKIMSQFFNNQQTKDL